jgi:hypothetical protein
VGYTAHHSILNIPFHNNKDKFYVFTQHVEDLVPLDSQGFRSFQYSLIDMSYNNGLGKVLIKDSILLSGIRYEPFAAVKHGNGRDWWVVIPHDLKPLFYKYLITDDGIKGPFEQIELNKLSDSLGTNHKSIFTPDGSKFIHYHSRLGTMVYDFDRCTGTLSNPVKIEYPKPSSNLWQGVDCEVSANSRYLYIVVQNFSKLVQYDLWSNNIPMSGDTVAVYDGFVDGSGTQTGFSLLQRSPNGKIYVYAGQLVMHVINAPDLPGMACEVLQHSIDLPTWTFGSMPYFPNYRLYDLPASPCDTLGIDTPISTIQQPDIPLVEGLLYPNPAQEQASLYLPGWQGAGRVTITDALGRVVLEQVVSRDRTTFQVRNWPSGVYAVLVWKEGRLVAAEQLVVQGN